MKAPAPLLPRAEPQKANPSLALVQRARGAVMDKPCGECTHDTLAERARKPLQAKRAFDTGYGDLIAMAQTAAPRTPDATGMRARDDIPVQRAANPLLPQELPQPMTCGIIITPGDKFSPKWQCKDVPGIGTTPALPIDPRLLPDFLREEIKKALPKPTPGPDPGKSTPPIVIPAPDPVVKTICALRPALCQLPQVPSKKPPNGFHLKLDTVRVLFKQGHPKSGDSPAQAMLAGGPELLKIVIERLKADPLLSVHLIGNSSMEGEADVNLAISTGRVELVSRVIADAGRSFQVFTPPLTFDSAAADCDAVGLGQFSCGELHANQKSIDPRDRNVLITFFRFETFKSMPPPPFGFPPDLSVPFPAGPF